MWGMIKKLFAKEEAIEKVASEKLEEWFEGRAGTAVKEAEAKIDAFRRELQSKINETRESLRELEKSELRNPQISVREKQFMEGNRKSYIQRTEILLKEMEGVIKHELNFFFEQYNESVDSFTKSTFRAYRILQEFFANEAREIALKIKEIDKSVEGIKGDFESSVFSEIERIRKELSSLKNKIKKREHLENEIKLAKQEMSMQDENNRELQKRKEEIISSEEHKQLARIEEEKKEIEAKINELKENIYNDFAVLDRALRKYTRIAFQESKLVEYYAADAFNALISDSGLKINGILEAVRKNIENHSIDLKNSDKVIELIERMDANYFKRVLERYSSFSKHKHKIEMEINDSKIKEELEAVGEKIMTAEENIKRLVAKISGHESERESINIRALREKLRQDIERLFRTRVEFV